MTRQVPLQITFHGIPQSDAVEASVREHVDRLATHSTHFNSCKVTLEGEGMRHREGRIYHVRIELGTNGSHIVVDRAPQDGDGQHDLYAAVAAAFTRATRILDQDAQRKRHEVKAHSR